MQTIETHIDTKGQEASRFEILVRLVYWIPLAIVLYVLSLLYTVAWVLNFGSVIIRGMRSARISGFIKMVVDYQYKFLSYYSFLTDERPPILPE